MYRVLFSSESQRKSYIDELLDLGLCDLCVIRYLGASDSSVYKNKENIHKIVHGEQNATTITAQCQPSPPETPLCPVPLKLQKPNPCSSCLGLLQEGIDEEWLNIICDAVQASEIQSASYCPTLSLPISAQIRAFTIWFHLENKFPNLMKQMDDLKPEGWNMKSVWKWLCSDKLREKIDPKSPWVFDGLTDVRIDTKYGDEELECKQLQDFIVKSKKKMSRKHDKVITRNAVESNFRKMSYQDFAKDFDVKPSIPTESLKIYSVFCQHGSLYIAGRYNKYSRTLSQTPWIIDGKRRTETSVEELISGQIIDCFKAKETRFSSSGREDVDVRMLGRGRPFVFEILSPKRSKVDQDEITKVEESINKSTDKIRIRDLQLVNKKELDILKHGEESKTKTYNAICITPGHKLTDGDIKKLNEYPVPITLSQRTPIRVLHRRSLATRKRNILQMEASLIPERSDIFKLTVTTQAGTYVKEFVHGDFGRTTPNVNSLLGLEADILALDVVEVDLDWPAQITS